MEFTFGNGHFARGTGLTEGVIMTSVHTMYPDWMRRLTEYKIYAESSSTRLRGLVESKRHLKEVMKARFERNFEIGLCTMKLHLLEHLLEDLERFGNLEIWRNLGCMAI